MVRQLRSGLPLDINKGKKMRFSKTTGCFYPEDIDYPVLPSDLIEVSKPTFDAAMARSPGQPLDVVAGVLVILPAPGPVHADLVDQTKAAARSVRQPILGVLDGMQASALTNGDQARAMAIETAKQGLKDITKVDLSAYQTETEMRQAIQLAYIGIAKALPVQAQVAFAEVLL